MESPTSMPAWVDFAADLGPIDEHFPSFEEMTAAELNSLIAASWPEDSRATGQDPGHTKSPSPSSHPHSSLSPEDGSLQYTPSNSTLPDWENEVNLNLHYDAIQTSPVFSTSTTNDSNDTSPVDSRSSVYSSMSRPPHSSNQANSSARRSRDQSAAPSAPHNATAQWGSFATNINMAGQQQPEASHAPSNFSFDDAALYSTAAFNESLLADMSFPYNNALPYRPPTLEDSWRNFNVGSAYSPLADGSPLAQDWTSLPRSVAQASNVTPFPTPDMYGVQQNRQYPQASLSTAQASQQQPLPPYPSQISTTQGSRLHRNDSHPDGSMHTPASTSTNYMPTPVSGPQPIYAHSTQRRYANPSISLDTSSGMVKPPQEPIALAHVGSTRKTTQPQSPDDSRRPGGGRKKGSNLNPASKKRVAVMRKTGACWRCAMQRDPCDGGDPCERCIKGANKPGSFFFPCNRSKIPDFILDFLPPQASMTLMHQKQPIEDYVQEQVRGWDVHRPIDVYLTCGYGHALRWRLYEFDPRSIELLGQYQYLQDVTTKRSVRFQKYSPPLGLMKLDPTDDTYFRNYLDELMEQRYLYEFAWTCFEEETQINEFQAVLLQLMCNLYQQTTDYDIRELLRRIIRMMIITYIMGHTLTISEDTLPSVISHIRHPFRPSQVERHTSPRLANRQLKFFFGVLRGKIYEDLLKWQQATLHTSGKKDESWLPAFCVMIGFAMVLEEQQRTIQIQADAKASKGEKSPEEAQQEALNACERMDEKYKLLIGLFQCKYRDKKWTRGSFGPQTPTMKEGAQVEFLKEVRSLVEDNVAHLQTREKVTFASENQCQYTSRLVARFLLPFLSLPA